jgi:hypothetical protein
VVLPGLKVVLRRVASSTEGFATRSSCERGGGSKRAFNPFRFRVAVLSFALVDFAPRVSRRPTKKEASPAMTNRTSWWWSGIGIVIASTSTVACGSATKNATDEIAVARRIEAQRQISASAARLGAATMTGGDVDAATRKYLVAVEGARGLLPRRYLLTNREVGLHAMSARIDAWCHPCARQLDRRAHTLRAS